ncbi:MAG: CRTAC1 family protein, partial [Ignavibacteria bacterium]|nr:CRTAC1 family protein [Ignavibacteria bacterium]
MAIPRLFRILTILLISTVLWSPARGQTFTKLIIDDQATHAGGASWVDIDQDGDLDLYVTNMITSDSTMTEDRLFRNNGDGTFVKDTQQDIVQVRNHTRGVTWGDYDNDGDQDAWLSNRNFLLETTLGSLLYMNDGTGEFVRVMSGDISGANTFSGMGGSWGDYDNDGFLDLFMTTARGLAYPGDTTANVLFDNRGDGTFARNFISELVTGPFDAYTTPSWCDYDRDGDLDLAVTMGPVETGVLQPDRFFLNQLVETGVSEFVLDTVSTFATQPRDGQEIRWVDYDNDRDFDLYVTNYGGTPGTAPGMGNDLYRNDGGTFVKVVTGAIVTDEDITLGQTWGDFDNDGDLDLYTCNQTSSQHFSGGNRLYRNDGPPDYEFTRINTGDVVSTNRIGWSAPAGDYDNDGDLDLYVTINTAFNVPDLDALYRNDLTPTASWVNITCEGAKRDGGSAGANRSAIGAIVMMKCRIGGVDRWQMRQIGGSESFNGQSSLRVHFGMGDAVMIDSLMIDWPGSGTEIYTDVEVNRFYLA